MKHHYVCAKLIHSFHLKKFKHHRLLWVRYCCSHIANEGSEAPRSFRAVVRTACPGGGPGGWSRRQPTMSGLWLPLISCRYLEKSWTLFELVSPSGKWAAGPLWGDSENVWTKHQAQLSLGNDREHSRSHTTLFCKWQKIQRKLD